MPQTSRKAAMAGHPARQLLSSPPRCFPAPAQAIHTCAVRFPDVAAQVLHLLCDFLSDTNTASALDVIYFIREIIQARGAARAAACRSACHRAATCQVVGCSQAPHLIQSGPHSLPALWCPRIPTPLSLPACVHAAAAPLACHCLAAPRRCLSPARRPTPSCTTPSSSG